MGDIIPKTFIKGQAEKLIDFPNDFMKVALLSGTYDECYLKSVTSFNQLSAYEVPPIYGYPQGGLIVSNKTVSVSNINDDVVFDMNDVGMTVSGGTFGPTRYGVLYDLDANNNIVYIFDFGGDKTVNDGAQFKIQIDANGLMIAKSTHATCTICE
jgi:hypothetical protein